jgi:hypothetical protein
MKIKCVAISEATHAALFETKAAMKLKNYDMVINKLISEYNEQRK